MGVFTLGKDCRLYRGTAGATADTLVTGITDLTLNMRRDRVDASDREGGQFKKGETTLAEAELTWTMKWKPSDAGFAAIQQAFRDNAPIALLPLDGPVATPGSQGIDADWKIADFSRTEPVNDLVKVNVTAIISDAADREPDWFEVETP